MFSKELLELDRNTVQYMIDEMQDEIDAQKKALKQTLEEKEQILAEQGQILAKKDNIIEKQRQENKLLKEKLEELTRLHL